MKGAFVNTIFASGDGRAELVARTSFDSNNPFISFSSWHFILKSNFRGKLIFPKSVKYFSRIL